MAQNIYDDPGFFARYSQLERSVHGLEGAAEWPAMRDLLPPTMEGLRVVDLGCGFGWFCRWAGAHGAAGVLGIDVSDRMLARAVAQTEDARITYRRADLEQLALPDGAYDLAYSSLALHYLADLEPLFATVRHALGAGGRFVFSVEHPVYTAPRRPDWSKGVDGQAVWPVDQYLVEGPRVTDWLSNGVRKYHRTVATYLNALIRNGFAVVHVEEWGPSDAQIAARPVLAAERERPMFLLLAAEAGGSRTSPPRDGHARRIDPAAPDTTPGAEEGG